MVGTSNLGSWNGHWWGSRVAFFWPTTFAAAAPTPHSTRMCHTRFVRYPQMFAVEHGLPKWGLQPQPQHHQSPVGFPILKLGKTGKIRPVKCDRWPSSQVNYRWTFSTPWDLSIWVNYNDLTATSLESWLIREIIPKWPNNSGWWNIIICPGINVHQVCYWKSSQDSVCLGHLALSTEPLGWRWRELLT